MIPILSADEYNYAKSRGYEPLADLRFDVEPKLRVMLQNTLFWNDEEFYKFCLSHYPHICQETGQPLYEAGAVNVSHIMTRGAHPEMRHDPRNVNILCYRMHNLWEFGDRSKMRIYERNCEIIQILKKDYKLN